MLEQKTHEQYTKVGARGNLVQHRNKSQGIVLVMRIFHQLARVNKNFTWNVLKTNLTMSMVKQQI